MEFCLKYKDALKPVRIPEKANVTLLDPQPAPARNTIRALLSRATESAGFKERLKNKNPSSVAIAVQDIAESVPTRAILQHIIDQVTQALPHLDASSITMILANGLHPHARFNAAKSKRHLLNMNSCNVVVHDAHDARMKDFGATGRGTPVKINAAFGEADFKMVIGVIEPHQFYGFTGGAKEAAIGCGSEDTIRHNHALIKNMPAHNRVFGKTPMREDIDEAGRLIGIDFAVNLVLNPDCGVAHVFSGDAEEVLKKGMAACEAIFGIESGKKFDMVLASCADAPEDLGFLWAQKSFSLVSRIAKKGGQILLLAALHKGLGEDVYFDYVCPSADPAAIEEEFIYFWHEMGARAADGFGGMLLNPKILDNGDLDSGILNHCHLRAADPSSIMAEWVEDFEGTPDIAVIPRAAATYFF